jgi:hypothetical protein
MKYFRFVLIIFLALNLPFQTILVASPIQAHVVRLEEVRDRLDTHSAARMKRIQDVQLLLHHNLVQKEVEKLLDLDQVNCALAALDDGSLDQLVSQSRELDEQVEAGASRATGIAIAVAVAVGVVVVLLAARDDSEGCCCN